MRPSFPPTATVLLTFLTLLIGPRPSAAAATDPFPGVYEDATGAAVLYISDGAPGIVIKSSTTYAGEFACAKGRFQIEAVTGEDEDALLCTLKPAGTAAGGVFVVKVNADGVATIDSPLVGKHALKRYAGSMAEAEKIKGRGKVMPGAGPPVAAVLPGATAAPKTPPTPGANPLAPAAPADNPLAKPDAPKPPPDPFVGTFANDKLTLALATAPGGGYSGTIEMGAARYTVAAIKAPGDANKLTGTFLTPAGASFDLTIAPTEKGVTLSTGGTDYALARPAAPAAPANPLATPAKPPVIAPTDPAASKLVGKWLTRTKDMEVWCTFRPDGTGTRAVRTVDGREASEFTWRLTDNRKLDITSAEGQVTHLFVTFETDNTVTIVDEKNDGLRMLRQAQQ